MKPFASLFASLFDHGTLDNEAARRRQIHRDWDLQRSLALTPSERSEIDAIFSRNL